MCRSVCVRSESSGCWFILLLSLSLYRSIGSLSTIGELHSSEEGEGYAVTAAVVVVLQDKKNPCQIRITAPAPLL